MTDHALPGTLVRSRVVDRPAAALAALLDRRFTGHVALDPVDALLLDDAGRGILGLVEGVPRTAYHAGTDTTGRAALEALTGPGPFRVASHACPADRVGEAVPGGPVAPTAPARVLAADDALARRTAAAAPDEEPPEPDLDAVEAFLADEDAVEALQERARAEAASRAAEWGLTESPAVDVDAEPDRDTHPTPDPGSDRNADTGPGPTHGPDRDSDTDVGPPGS